MSLTASKLLEQTAFLREKQLVGDKKHAIPGILPFSRATLWRMVSVGAFPKPIKLTERTTAWPTAEVRGWIDNPSGYRQATVDN